MFCSQRCEMLLLYQNVPWKKKLGTLSSLFPSNVLMNFTGLYSVSFWMVYKSHDTNKLVGLDHQFLHPSWSQLLFDSFLFHPWYSSSESQHESSKNGWLGSYTFVHISIIHNVDKENVMYCIVESNSVLKRKKNWRVPQYESTSKISQ